jgi:hypothetical protein
MSFYNDGTTDLEVDFDKNVTRLYESISASDWDVALSDVVNNPKEAKTWVVRHHEDGQIAWRFLPIHSACARQPPENLMNELLSAYRHGAQCRDDQGMLPLHYACGNQASTETIRLLILAYPDGATIADPNGMLPLHYIAQWGPSSMEAVEALLFAHRNALKVRDNEDKTPMDLAREGEYSEMERQQVIQVLQKFSQPSQDSASTLTPGTNASSYPAMNMSHQSNPRQQRTYEPQQTNLKEFDTMPSTSNAVKRLQEAAAAQQHARENYLRSSESVAAEGRDDDSILGTMLPKTSMYSGASAYNNRTPSVRGSASVADDMGTTYTMDTSANRMVSQLKVEVEKLRTEASMAEAEAKRQVESERIEMQKAVDEMKAKLANCEKETMESLSELTAKEEFGQYIETRLKDKESELAAAMQKNERLRTDLENTKLSISKYKEKSSKLDSHLLALSKSMAGMMDEQEQIMQASARHEEHMKKVSLARQQKMQELIDQEVSFARVSLEKQKQSDLGSEEMINAALESQKKLMAAVAGVLGPKEVYL